MPDYTSIFDMIDGGGAGRSGDSFEGGGLLSDIANALFQPRGYRDRMRQMPDVRPVARPAPPPMPSPAPMPQRNVMPLTAPPVVESAPLEPVYSGRGNYGMPMPEPVYSGRGSYGMPYPEFAQTDEERAVIDYLRQVGGYGY